MHTVGLVLRVLAVFALLGATLWVLRRGMPGHRRTSMVQVVESVRLGKSASASLLRVGDTTYLVGVTDHGVALLAQPTLPEAEEPAEEAEAVTAAAPAGPPTMRAFVTTVAGRGVEKLRAVRSRLEADADEVAARKPRTAFRRPTIAAFVSAFGDQLRQLRPVRPQLAAAGAGGAALALDASPGFESVLAEELEQLDQVDDDEPGRTAVLSAVPDAEDEYDAEHDDEDVADEEVAGAQSLGELARQLQMLDQLPKTLATPTTTPTSADTTVADGPAAEQRRPTPTPTHQRSNTRTDAPRYFDEEHPWSLPCRRARQHTGPRATSLV